MGLTLEHVAIAFGAGGLIAGILSFGFLGIVVPLARIQ